jgi:thiamine kinase-like enzyme
LLEDIAPASQDDVVTGMTREHAEALARAEARFHAVLWDRTDAPAVEWLPAWRGDVALRRRLTAERLPVFMARYGERLAPSVREMASELPRLLGDAYAGLEEGPQTVVHADLHAENVLFRPTGEPVILDWTDASRGPAAADVARLLVEAPTIDARRAHEDDLLRVYVAELAERGVTGYGVERLRRHVRHAQIALFAWTVRWVGGEVPPDGSVPRMEAIVHNLIDNCAAALQDWIARSG